MPFWPGIVLPKQSLEPQIGGVQLICYALYGSASIVSTYVLVFDDQKTAGGFENFIGRAGP